MQDQSHPTLTESAAAVVTATLTAPAADREEGVSTMFCTQCGTRNGSDAKFCKQCGHKLDRTGPLKISDEEFQLPESREEKVRNLLISAFQKYEANDLDGAITVCREALDLRPESTDAHSLMSTLYEKKGDREKAIEERERVLELNPGSIADREKLDELRGDGIAATPRKVNSARRAAPPALLTSTRAQAMAAVAAIIVVFGIGIGAMAWVARQQKQPVNAPVKPTVTAPNTPPVTGPGTAAANTQSAPPAAQQNQPAVTNSSLLAQNEAARNAALIKSLQNQINQQRQQHEPEAAGFGTRQVGPASVNPQFPATARLTGGAMPERGNSVTLPENEPGNEPASAQQQPASTHAVTQSQARPPAPPQGKIEIIVSPGQASGSGNTASASKPPASDGANVDSRSSLQIARDLQTRGEYSKAVSHYKKALDGAGDSAGEINQQIAICYSRMGERDAAINFYNHAIESFEAQITAGKNVDSARNGVRICKNGIKALQ